MARRNDRRAGVARHAAKLSNHTMRIWILVVVLAGCKPTPDCASAVSGAVDRMIEDARGRMPPGAAANVARIKNDLKRVVTEACVEDHWAPAVITCVDHGRDKQELDACDKQLTKEQHDSEHKRMDEVLRLAIQPLPPMGSALPP